MGVGILNVGQDGKYERVSQGIGLGVRQHKDVMLSWGYSNKITKKFTLAGGDFAVLTLRVPAGVNHHAESRFIQAYNAEVNFKIVIDKEIGDLSAVVDTIPVFNQKYAVLNPDALSVVEFRGTSGTNPIGTVDENNTMDELDLYATSGGFFEASTSKEFSSLSGRYYTGLEDERIIVALFENTDTSTATITFVYAWHEFE